MRTRFSLLLWIATLLVTHLPAAVPVDMSGYKPECGANIAVDGDVLRVMWTENTLIFDLNDEAPLIRSLSSSGALVISNLDPFLSLTVGNRESPSGRPPQMSPWNVFFDNPPKRPYQTFMRTFTKKKRSRSCPREITPSFASAT